MYTVKFMFDYGADSCLWGMEDEGLLSTQSFPISKALRDELENLSIEYTSILNWDDPAAGFVWTAEQIENFRMRAQRAYDDLVAELGGEYQIQNDIHLSLGIENPQ